jgi:hypothetical protein
MTFVTALTHCVILPIVYIFFIYLFIKGEHYYYTYRAK